MTESSRINGVSSPVCGMALSGSFVGKEVPSSLWRTYLSRIFQPGKLRGTSSAISLRPLPDHVCCCCVHGLWETFHVAVIARLCELLHGLWEFSLRLLPDHVVLFVLCLGSFW